MSQAANVSLNQSPYPRLTRNLSAVESWGFGLTGHISWVALVPSIHAALGAKAIFVWIPAVMVGMLINYQVKRLGMSLMDIAGGTPNYITHLLKNYPGLALYAAIGYLLNWVSYLSVNTIVLRDLIKVNLQGLNIVCPDLLLDIALTILPFVLAFSGTRALSILHLFFVLPAFLILLLFCIQGLTWLAIAPESPGFFPATWEIPSFVDWAKWFFFVSYATYSCETASSFVADSQNPQKTLRFLDFAAWIMPPIFWGGSWVMMRLATAPGLEDNAFLNLVAAAHPFWGKFTTLSVTFLLVSSCLLGSATVVSNCPRILYQLALDKYLSPVFSMVSHQGVFTPGLSLVLAFCLMYLFWGKVDQIVAIGNVGWFICFIFLHFGLWLRRNQPHILFPRLSLGILLIELVILIVGGLAWGRNNLLCGFIFPIGVMGINALIQFVPFPPFRVNWWMRKYKMRSGANIRNLLLNQVITLIFLLCSAAIVGWLFGVHLHEITNTKGESLIIVLVMIIAFVGVAIACWTSLPQVVELAEAREAPQHLFKIAPYGIVVVDDQGIIQQANPAIALLFAVKTAQLEKHHLNIWLPELTDYPQDWQKHSEQEFIKDDQPHTLLISVSDRPNLDFRDYVVIIHDITERKKSEQILQQSEALLREKAQQLAAKLVQSEKMSSLGQLVAGVAHEINNPVSFIYGNINPASQYIDDLIGLLKLYELNYPQPVPQIQDYRENIDLDFLVIDLPKLLTSMEIGTKRITEIVTSLRNFSRLDEAEIKAVNIHDGIDSTLMILGHRLKAVAHRPEIKVIKEYGNLPLIECYAGQLNQVFMNILVNAIDSLEESLVNSQQINQLQIQIQTLVVSNQKVVVRILDNGIGIPENIQKHLFEPFFTTKPIGKGTGLGLSLSYQIIQEKHGGELNFNSSLGQGTEFVITIPLKQSKYGTFN